MTNGYGVPVEPKAFTTFDLELLIGWGVIARLTEQRHLP